MNFDNCTVNGLGNSNAQPVLVDSGVGTGLITSVNFIGGSFTHPGSGGLPIIWLKAPASASESYIEGVSFIGCQFESSNTGDIGILIENARDVFMEGLVFTSAVNAGSSCIEIKQGSGGAVVNVIIQGICNFDAWTNTINDLMNSILITDPRVVSYLVAAAGSTIEQWVGAYGTYGSIAQMTKTGLVLAGTLQVGGATPTVSSGQVGFGVTTSTTASTTPGGSTLPTLAAGYLEINIGGTTYKLPYYKS